MRERYVLGISEYTTRPRPFEDDVERYARHGAGAIEVTEEKLDPLRRAEQLASIPAMGLTVSSVQAKVHALFPTFLQPEPRKPAERLRHIRASIQALAPHVPPGTPFVCITGAPPDGDIAAVLECARHEFAQLAAFAETHGVRIALEPLNPSLMNVDSALWSLADALALVEDIDHPAFGLCVDAWNIWQSPGLDATIGRAAGKIFLVQVSDWRTPRGRYDRLVPGAGDIPLAGIVGATEAAGYTGPYVVEIFSSESLPDSLWRADPDSVVSACVRGFEAVWQRAGDAAEVPS